MALPSLLLDFAVILIAAEIGGTIFRALRMPRVVGMLIAGIALGPFTPGYVVDPAEVEGLALLGAVFLMFSTGLAFDIRNFRRLGLAPFLLAALGVGASFSLGFLVGLGMGWPLLSALFVGLILTSTSTTLGLKFLADFGLTSVPGADLVTAAILVDDILALVLMTLVVGVLGPTAPPVANVLLGLGAILALAFLLLWLGTHALPRLLRVTDILSPSSTVMVAVSLALLVSFGFAVIGLPPLVGAFFAGSIVASTEYGARVSRHMTSVTSIFMGVFFTSIGFLIDPTRLPAVALPALLLIAVAIGSKVLPGALALRRVSGIRRSDRWGLGAVLVPRAEISLIIAQYGILSGVAPDILALAMAVMIGTALFPSAIVRLAREERKGGGTTAGDGKA